MRFHDVKQCPSCGWCYDPSSIHNRLYYGCCPECGFMDPEKYDDSFAWPTVAARIARRWWAPWTWMRPRFEAKLPKESPHA